MVEFSPQPGQRETQIVTHNMDGTAEHGGGFLGRHASEVSHLDQFCEVFVFERKRVESTVQFQKLQFFNTSGSLDLQAVREANVATAFFR